MATSGPAFTRLTPEDRRSHLLDVANELFAEHGYDAVSVEGIAAAAGVTRGLVHHYFGGKRDVYVALLERLGDAAQRAIDVPEDGTLDERVALAMRQWIAWVSENRTIWLATAARGDAIEDTEIRAMLDERRQVIVSQFMRMAAGRRSNGVPLEFALWSWLGLNQAACRGWLAGQATADELHGLLTGTLAHILRSAQD